MIEFIYDVVCPYAYLASTQVDAVAQRVGVQVSWRPVLLGGLFREIGGPPDPNASMPPAKAELTARDIERWAELYGVPLARPAAHPRRSVDAMRLCTVAEGERRIAVSRALFSAYWVEGRDVADPRVLQDIATAHGIEPAMITAPQTKQALRDATAAAAAQGAFGVPTFIVGNRLWWGQDRLPLVEAALGGEPSLDRHAASAAPPGPRAGVTFFHDFSSPFSYLASLAIDAVAQRHGVTVAWTPILLGGLFRAIGTPDVPLLSMPAVKRDYVRRDLEDWAAARRVPFAFPTHFPLRSVLPLRVALIEPRATPAIYRAAWADNRRIDDAASLREVLLEAELPADDLLARADDSAVKARLRENTELAQAVGACGVPTITVERSQSEARLLLWGQDRLAMLDAALAGWWPRCG